MNAAPNARYFDELTPGTRHEERRMLTGADIDAFAEVSGDHNPLHTDATYARAAGFEDRIAHGMLLGSWISAVLAQKFPGAGTVYLRQGLEFRSPALPGMELLLTLEVTEQKRRGRVLIDCRITHESKELLRGSAEVIAPSREKS